MPKRKKFPQAFNAGVPLAAFFSDKAAELDGAWRWRFCSFKSYGIESSHIGCVSRYRSSFILS